MNASLFESRGKITSGLSWLILLQSQRVFKQIEYVWLGMFVFKSSTH